MPTCRVCRGNFTQDQFISGNGPRYLVCANCGVEQGMVTPDEVPQLYDDAIMRARFTAVARRHSLWFWLIVGWSLWVFLFNGTPLWGNASLIVLILATLFTPVRFFLKVPSHRAEMRRLTP